MRPRLAIWVAAIGLTVVAGAAGAVISAVVLPRGKAVTFAGDKANWSCLNDGRLSQNAITCLSGDAEPYVKLSRAGIVVRVYNLRKACVRRVLRPSPDPSDPAMKPYWEYVYAFTPSGCR